MLTNTCINHVSGARRKVSVSICECGGGSVESGKDPPISIVSDSVVRVELLKVGVRTADGAVQHLGIGAGAETLDGACIIVVRERGVGIGNVVSNSSDGQHSGGIEASVRVGKTSRKTTNLTVHVDSLVVVGGVLNVKCHGTHCSRSQSLSFHMRTIGRDTLDAGTLCKFNGERGSQHHSCIRLAVGTLRVDLLGGCETRRCLESQLNLNRCLIQINRVLQDETSVSFRRRRLQVSRLIV